ncbi:phosphoribosylformylglycinamidine synthase, partial [Candidatus Falkowbacteria bacterium]|nr:phosphoribosylformylglycinamidine synthase [Candidatus Falkowbacteria bacterium]
AYIAGLYDPMRERIFQESIKTFDVLIEVPELIKVPIIGNGESLDLMAKANEEYDLGFDEAYQRHFFDLFVNKLKRDPTEAELLQLREMCSNHSRHGLFGSTIVINSETMDRTLMEMIKETWKQNPKGSMIAFHDNASAITGSIVSAFRPKHPGRPSRMIYQQILQHITLTVETHCFPTLWSPWPGSETGLGGCLRDGLAVGRGGDHRYAIAGFCTGNLFIPGYEMPWEKGAPRFESDVMASPLQIMLEAPGGAWSYGNRYGVPVIQGITRTFGMVMPNGEHYEYYKPIMMAGLAGVVEEDHIEKREAKKLHKVVGIGGPAYLIGVGGGSGSSNVSDEKESQRNLNAVQRGDALMAQLTWRVIRACIELGINNPIRVIHDQGAAGPCGVLTELIEKTGGQINLRRINVGDPSMGVTQIWIAEYQERYGLLIDPDRLNVFLKICEREGCPVENLGMVSGDGKIVVYDGDPESKIIDLPIEEVLSGLPKQTIKDYEPNFLGGPVNIPKDLTFIQALKNVFNLPAVGSKEFLVDRVDHSVGGLVVQGQRCGPLGLPISNVAVAASGYRATTGAASAIGECPNKTMLDAKAGVRMAVAEMLTNIVSAGVVDKEQIKASVNWMWAAKGIRGGVAKLYYAMEALKEFMISLGIAADGGKDSTSLAVKIGEKLIKSPETCMITGYGYVPDICRVLAPDIKRPGESSLYYIDLGGGKYRLGGSAFLQTLKQIGDECPDIDDRKLFLQTWLSIQKMIKTGNILSLHDRSDGGLVTAILEMAMAGNCGVRVKLEGDVPWVNKMFAEEAGYVLEIADDQAGVLSYFEENQIPIKKIGQTLKEQELSVNYNGNSLLSDSTENILSIWRETGVQIDSLQANPDCVTSSFNIRDRKDSPYNLTFTPTPAIGMMLEGKAPKVAVIRNQGTNGDREMMAALEIAGFQVFDVNMYDLTTGATSLRNFQGIVFPGGFSYGDVFGAGKGWTMQILQGFSSEFRNFCTREDTWILGVCNGCQVGARLGLAPFDSYNPKKQLLFLQNKSKAFESRFVPVKILDTPSIMFTGMAGSVLGIYVAHAEGRVWFPDQEDIPRISNSGLVTMAYVDEQGEKTEKYPYNPNGSVEGWTGFCDPTGRFNIMMPHPERNFLLWQWPWLPDGFKHLETSPWLRAFQNLFNWSLENRIR